MAESLLLNRSAPGLASRATPAWARVAAPVLVVAVVLGFLLATRLSAYHGNPAGFVLFGRHNVHYTRPPVGAPINSQTGYDGQFYWLQATDPLLLHRSTIAGLYATWPGYHLQRLAYPALAFLLAGGSRSALPWTLLAINVLVVLGLTAAFSLYARRRGWSCWWALAVGLTPGLLMPALRDLSDPLAVAGLVGGLMAWQRGRPWLAGALLALGALTREPMVVGVAAVALDAGWRWWQVRKVPGSLKRALAQSWPAVAIPAGAFLAWQLYIHGLYAPTAAVVAKPVLPPLRDFVNEVTFALGHDSPLTAVWDLAYLGLILAGMCASLVMLLRRPSAPAMAAVLCGVSVSVIFFGDQWGDTRYSAPMFLALLLAGLESGSRRVPRLCAAVAAMTIFLPVAVVGI
jgi:hypothetical protein